MAAHTVDLVCHGCPDLFLVRQRPTEFSSSLSHTSPAWMTLVLLSSGVGAKLCGTLMLCPNMPYYAYFDTKW